MSLAQRISQIAPSPTLGLDAKAKALKASGLDIISFGVGEPDFNTPEHVKAAGIKAIEDNFTRYTQVEGIPDLKAAIVAKFVRDNDLNFAPDQVVVSCGGKHTLYNLAQVMFQSGDEVIIPAPYWVSYPPIILLAGAKPVIVPTLETNGFKMNADQLAQYVTTRTKAIILNSPSNPTGSVYTRQELAALAEVVLKNNLWVISDDIYEKILYGDNKFCNMANLAPELKEKTIIAHGLSKTYAMTGWRIGFMAGPKEIASAVTKLQSQSTSNPCSIAQKAGVAALNGPQDSVSTMVAAFDQRRRCLVETLNAMPGVTCNDPGGAFYVFPRVSAYYGRSVGGRMINGSSDLADYLLEEAKIAVVPGSAFGDDTCVRLSYAISLEDNRKGLDRMVAALERLK
ncbi:MAG: pyridoxal phosphate-dependent aminotransferase [Deltaproteobacteria bacterium]|nr:pyridoxal phosphate-dependent aminotransferase [Deltaproteobacteria bacterium]